MIKTLFMLPLLVLSLGTLSSHLPDGSSSNDSAFVLEEKSDKSYKITAICDDFKENDVLEVYELQEVKR